MLSAWNGGDTCCINAYYVDGRYDDFTAYEYQNIAFYDL